MNFKNNTKQLILYLIVGGIATVVEWVLFYILNTPLRINYLFATALAFVISTFSNWLAGRLIMFKSSGKLWLELIQIYLTSIAGLLMNLIIMWLAVELLSIAELASKMLATVLVFSWNFLIRKFVIYKGKDDEIL